MNRSFGLLFVAVSVLLGALAYWENRPSYIVWAGLAALFLLISLLLPRVLAPLRRGWLRIGQVLGRIMNPLVLAVVYAAVIIPVGGLMRLFHRDALARSRPPAAASYWIARTGEEISADRLKDQF
jgi:Saxitoxin biosynthesis operon protein SxtJ